MSKNTPGAPRTSDAIADRITKIVTDHHGTKHARGLSLEALEEDQYPRMLEALADALPGQRVIFRLPHGADDPPPGKYVQYDPFIERELTELRGSGAFQEYLQSIERLSDKFGSSRRIGLYVGVNSDAAVARGEVGPLPAETVVRELEPLIRAGISVVGLDATHTTSQALTTLRETKVLFDERFGIGEVEVWAEPWPTTSKAEPVPDVHYLTRLDVWTLRESGKAGLQYRHRDWSAHAERVWVQVDHKVLGDAILERRRAAGDPTDKPWWNYTVDEAVAETRRVYQQGVNLVIQWPLRATFDISFREFCNRVAR